MQETRRAPLVADRYQLDRFLAAGGFGAVWAATDVALGRPVAVKVLHEGYAGHPEALTRFRAEARSAGALCHENIARIYDYGEPPDALAPYLVMELVPGPSLADLLADGPLDPVRVADIVAQTAAGLDAAHRAGLVHRDIKPGNLLVAPDGQVKITDFGIAHAVGSVPLTRTGQLMGTPGYLAPERACGAQATPLSDLYALGMLAWECLAGAPPFTGSAVEVAVAHRDRPLPPLPPFVPADVADLVVELTAKHPAARPETAGYVARRAAMIRDRLAAGSSLLANGPPRPLSTLEMPALERPAPDRPAPPGPDAPPDPFAETLTAGLSGADHVAPVSAPPASAGPAPGLSRSRRHHQPRPSRRPRWMSRPGWVSLAAGSLTVAILGLVLGTVLSQLPSRSAPPPPARPPRRPAHPRSRRPVRLARTVTSRPTRSAPPATTPIPAPPRATDPPPAPATAPARAPAAAPATVPAGLLPALALATAWATATATAGSAASPTATRTSSSPGKRIITARHYAVIDAS